MFIAVFNFGWGLHNIHNNNDLWHVESDCWLYCQRPTTFETRYRYRCSIITTELSSLHIKFQLHESKNFCFHWLSMGLKLLRWNRGKHWIALLIVFFAQSPQRIYQSWHRHHMVVWEIYSRSYQALIQIYLQALVVYTPRAVVLILEVYHRLLRLVSIVSTVICHSSLPPLLRTSG